MEYFEERNIVEATPEGCVAALLETVPLIMGVMRCEVLHRQPFGLSLPQFRALMFIKHRPGTSLTKVCDVLGLTPSSMSALIDRLVQRELVLRHHCDDDRRRISLTVTPQGNEVAEQIVQLLQQAMATKLQGLSSADCAHIIRAMSLISANFGGIANHRLDEQQRDSITRK